MNRKRVLQVSFWRFRSQEWIESGSWASPASQDPRGFSLAQKPDNMADALPKEVPSLFRQELVGSSEALVRDGPWIRLPPDSLDWEEIVKSSVATLQVSQETERE